MKILLNACLTMGFVAVGLFAHLVAYPYLRTQEILKVVTQGSMTEYRWLHMPHLDFRERNVEGASPDVRYSFCLFDLSKGDLKVELGDWDGFQLLGIHAMNSDVLKTYFREAPEEFRITLTRTDPELHGLTRGFLILRRELVSRKKPPTTDKCAPIP